jgi:hypothetical protein
MIAEQTVAADVPSSRRWTRCYNLANYCVEGGTARWKNYVLMEAIHCFFDRAHDLPPEAAKSVADRCFEKHAKKLLIALKPNKMILLGTPPYEAFRLYLEKKDIQNYDCGALTIDDLRIPVLRHLHPGTPVAMADGGFYRKDAYDHFKEYCNNFHYWT